MMRKTEPSFDDFWDLIIYPSIKKCMEEIDPDFSAEVNLQNRDAAEFRVEIEKTYKQKRAWLKKEYLPEEEHPSLDFHKLSSILCRCLIGNKYFTYNIRKAEQIHDRRKRSTSLSHNDVLAWEINNLLVNYKLAFFVGQGVAFYDMFFWAQSRIKSDNELLKKLTDNNQKRDIRQRVDLTEKFSEQLSNNEFGLRPYICSRTHDDFCSSMIVSLMKTDCLMRDFDYLMFGAIMFQWQEYTKRCIFTELILGETDILNSYLQFCLE